MTHDQKKRTSVKDIDYTPISAHVCFVKYSSISVVGLFIQTTNIVTRTIIMYQDAGYGDNWEPEGNNAR